MTYQVGDKIEVLENGKWKPGRILRLHRPGRYECEQENLDFGIYAEREIRPAAPNKEGNTP